MGHYQVRRRARLVVLIVLVLPLLATAQPVQVRRIAFLGFGPPPSAAAPRPRTPRRPRRSGGEERRWGPGGPAAGRAAGKCGGGITGIKEGPYQ